jgi:CopG family transcriptional regulator / antitoxin EndoAI
MAVSTVNISFQEDLLKQIDAIANEEARTRSELIREAARLYIEKKAKWKGIFTFGDSIVKNSKLTEKDVLKEIKNIRKK